MKRLLAEGLTILTAALALANPYAVTPMVFGKGPLFLAAICIGLWVSVWIDWVEK